MTAFTPEAARALGGPDWLVERRLAAAEQVGGIVWPTPADEIWRYSRIDEFDLDRYRPPSPDELGEPGPETAPGGGPVAAEAGERAGLVVVRNGRVVHHELDDTVAAKGVQVCGLATCEGADVAAVLGACSQASPDAFTVLHDAFLAGGAFIRVPAGVVVDKPIIVLH
jgi:Fe-S cluster assembly protein SufD